MLKKWYALLLTGFIMLILCCPLSASAAEAWIYDEGGRLSEKEYTESLSRLQQAADHTGMNIGIVMGTVNRTDYTIDTLAESTYGEVFGKGTDGLLYYMDLNTISPHDHIVTSGMGHFYYTNSHGNDRIAVIFDMLDDYLYPLGSEDAYGALMQFADEVEYFYEEGVPDHYYYYDDEYRLYYYLDGNGRITSSSRKPYVDQGALVIVVFCSFVVGILAALIVFITVKTRYKFKYSLSPTTYVNKKRVQYIDQYDHFVRVYTNKIYIGGNSGGGSGGGGGHGGGFSSGGYGGGSHNR